LTHAKSLSVLRIQDHIVDDAFSKPVENDDGPSAEVARREVRQGEACLRLVARMQADSEGNGFFGSEPGGKVDGWLEVVPPLVWPWVVLIVLAGQDVVRA
jgi:hypothetical protein